MNYMATAEAVLRELGKGKEENKGKEATLNSLLSLNSPSGEGTPTLNSLLSLNSPPKWKRGERQEVDRLSTPEQTAIIRRMIETGAVLILEAEDGVTYRCHQDGVEFPPDVDALPRYDLPQTCTIRAGIPPRGAAVAANRLLRNAKTLSRIAELNAKVAEC